MLLLYKESLIKSKEKRTECFRLLSLFPELEKKMRFSIPGEFYYFRHAQDPSNAIIFKFAFFFFFGVNVSFSQTTRST